MPQKRGFVKVCLRDAAHRGSLLKKAPPDPCENFQQGRFGKFLRRGLGRSFFQKAPPQGLYGDVLIQIATMQKMAKVTPEQVQMAAQILR